MQTSPVTLKSAAYVTVVRAVLIQYTTKSVTQLLQYVSLFKYYFKNNNYPFNVRERLGFPVIKYSINRRVQFFLDLSQRCTSESYLFIVILIQMYRTRQ